MRKPAMRQVAPLLLSVTCTIWFVEGPRQAFAQKNAPARKTVPAVPQKAPTKAPAVQQQGDLMIQQFEQQYGAQFRQLYKTELHFMRLVCQPTRRQYDKIAADGEPALKATMSKFAATFHRPVADEQPDPRMLVAEALVKLAQTNLSPEQAARYRTELDQRTAAQKRIAVLSLVCKMDKLLILTPEQRRALGEVLQNNWNEAWNQPQWLTIGGQYFPSMPDDKILPVLTETQKNVWRDTPKGNIRFGFQLGMLPVMEMEEEVWDDDRPHANPDRADGKAAIKDDRADKPVEKK
jgi:hypothetical protein